MPNQSAILKDLQELHALGDLYQKKLQVTMSKLGSTEKKRSPALKKARNSAETKYKVKARTDKRIQKQLKNSI